MKLIRIARSLLLLALAMSIGLHWMLLQSVAWVGMFSSFSRDNSLSTAVAMTFDGNHPCPLCLTVKANAGESPDSSPAKTDTLIGKELTCLSLHVVATFHPPAFSATECRLSPAPTADWSHRSDAPPVPPPRVLA